MRTTFLVVACSLIWPMYITLVHGCAIGFYYSVSFDGCRPCDNIGSGYYCPGNDLFYYCSGACPTGTFQSRPCNNNADRVCSACKTCAGGSYTSSACTSTADIVCTSCGSCAAGKYQEVLCTGSSAGKCSNCYAGSFSASARPSSNIYNGCELCGAGRYQPLAGQTSCFFCEAGKFNAGTVNFPTTCTTCNPGGWSGIGATNCSYCPEGRAPLSVGGTTCAACAVGSYSQAGAPCQTCPAGRYAPFEGSNYCHACVAGKFINMLNWSPTSQSAYCEDCPAGMYTHNLTHMYLTTF